MSVSPAADPLTVDSRVLASFRLPFIGGTVAIAHSRVKSDPFTSEPFDCGFHGAVMAMAAGIIAGLSLCALIKAAQFNHCAGTNGDPARIAHCAKWLR